MCNKWKLPSSQGLLPLLLVELLPICFPLGKRGLCQEFKKGLSASVSKQFLL